ncbi:CMGC/RCK/MAK protein kinase [Zymoseptoria brevis]|uniref:CMGC/RCK/MAK protein kinase n=1 Tax=Zymoseptoria brevis TaxID=1047168 RepID=A0A0F4GZC2_9PEZI|nr:CMGC/RCK/MAK protein kinase [Zymoseptoria brevis]
MTVAYENMSYRGWSSGSHSAAVCLEDKFEIIKDIGDGSFGSVTLGRTRSAGAHLVRRNTLVAIKTMKKTFENFAQCMELREVIFLKTLPSHPHLVPAYDIFLDPLSKKLHIAMEHMDGNLYQLMKARDHKPLDESSVKSILFQILEGLEHIHDHSFFHRDIKPENILVSTSAHDTGSAFKRYSSLVTPPSTPPAYTIKIADFGLARETHSRVPYTTYVSTRWYRAPEVLLRAGEYSAPVDIWAIGAMAVEIATLKPLFPGGNEVDQVWRVCEVMGSPGAWVNKHGQKVGGGEWKEGIKLAQKLGFSFPKMAPHSLETVLPSPQWPASLANFITWCLMWDPKVRPTSRQALEHEYFQNALDPLAPKSSSRAQSRASVRHDSDLPTKTASWFRKSLGPRDAAPPAVPQHNSEPLATQPMPDPMESSPAPKVKPMAAKRATWAHGNANAAPMPILPSIRPISPLPDAITAHANARHIDQPPQEVSPSKKIGRQLSVNSQGNHYAEIHRQEAERALVGASALKSPTGSQRESFFSHLRKRARRLSGRNSGVITPSMDAMETNAGCVPWAANKQPVFDTHSVASAAADPSSDPNFAELDRALQSVRYSLDAAANATQQARKPTNRVVSNPSLKRHHSLPHGVDDKTQANHRIPRRALKHATSSRYETPDEEEELLDEVMTSAHLAARRLDNEQLSRPPLPHVISEPVTVYTAPYLTPSHSKDQMSLDYVTQGPAPTNAVEIPPRRQPSNSKNNPQWPTPPYDENDWAAAAAASIFATQRAYQ